MIHFYLIKSIVYIQVHSLYSSIAFEKYIISCIHLYSMIQNSVTILKFPVLYLFTPLSSPKSLENTDLFTIFSFAFSRMQIALYRCNTFQNCFFHLVICISSSVSKIHFWRKDVHGAFYFISLSFGFPYPEVDAWVI